MESKYNHPEWKVFDKFFTRLLLNTGSCFERDVLRNCKDFLFSNWVREVGKYDSLTEIADDDIRKMLKAMGKTDEEIESAMSNRI